MVDWNKYLCWVRVQINLFGFGEFGQMKEMSSYSGAQTDMNAGLGLNQPRILKHFLQLFLGEVVNTYSVMFDIEIICEFSVSLVWHVNLPEVIPAIIPKIEEWPRLHPVCDFFNCLGVLLRHNCWQHKDHRNEIRLYLKGNFIFDQIANLDTESSFEFGVN